MYLQFYKKFPSRAFVKRKVIASGKQQNEKNFNYAL